MELQKSRTRTENKRKAEWDEEDDDDDGVTTEEDEVEMSYKELQKWIRDQVEKSSLSSLGRREYLIQLQSLLERKKMQTEQLLYLCKLVSTFERTVKELYAMLGWEYIGQDFDSGCSDAPVSEDALPVRFSSKATTDHGDKRPAVTTKEAMVVLTKLTTAEINAALRPQPPQIDSNECESSSNGSEMCWEPEPDSSDSDLSDYTKSVKRRKICLSRTRQTPQRTRKRVAVISETETSSTDGANSSAESDTMETADTNAKSNVTEASKSKTLQANKRIGDESKRSETSQANRKTRAESSKSKTPQDNKSTRVESTKSKPPQDNKSTRVESKPKTSQANKTREESSKLKTPQADKSTKVESTKSKPPQHNKSMRVESTKSKPPQDNKSTRVESTKSKPPQDNKSTRVESTKSKPPQDNKSTRVESTKSKPPQDNESTRVESKTKTPQANKATSQDKANSESHAVKSSTSSANVNGGTSVSQKSSTTTSNPPNLPPEQITVNMKVLARRKPLSWHPGRIAEIITKDGRVRYKVAFEEKGRSLVSGHHIAFAHQPKVIYLSIGARVLIESEDSEFMPGIVAEVPSRKNHMRFMVFVDDHTPVYVVLPKIRLVCRPLEDPLDDIPDSTHRDFMRQYLSQWPFPPQTHYRVGQKIRALYNGTQQAVEVLEVDSSLIQVMFEEDEHKEWIYRGSIRLEQMVLMIEDMEAKKNDNKKNDGTVKK